MSIRGIIYTSNTGYTEEYAELLSQASGLPAYPLDGRIPFQKGEPVFYMGWLRAGYIVGLSRAQKDFDVEGICGVGISPADAEQSDKLRRLYSMPQDAGVFYLQGGLDMKKLTGMNKILMLPVTAMMRRPLQIKGQRTPQEEKMLRTLTHGGSFVCPEALTPIVNWLGQAD